MSDNKRILDIRETREAQRRVAPRYQGAWGGHDVDVLLAEIDRLEAALHAALEKAALI